MAEILFSAIPDRDRQPVMATLLVWLYLSGVALGAHDAVHHGVLVEVEEAGIACPGKQVPRQLQDVVCGACLLRLPPFPTLAAPTNHLRSFVVSIDAIPALAPNHCPWHDGCFHHATAQP